MTELYFNFINENGEEERILVDSEKFIIGRHSTNDLSIVNSKLSRKHVQIERFADIFVISDLNSSNGTTLNDKDLIDPESLKDGDKLNLGGGVEIEVELISDNPYASNGSAGNSNDKEVKDEANEVEDAKSNSNSAGASTSTSDSGTNVASQKNKGSGLGIFFILAPLMGLAIIFIIGGALFFLVDRNGTEVAQNNNDFIYTSDEDDNFLDDLPENLSSEDDENAVETNPIPENTQSPTGTTENPPTSNPTNTSDSNPTNPLPNGTGTTGTPQGIETVSTPKPTKDTDKIRGLAFNFMRRIAKNDPKPIVTTKQLSVINSKIKQYRSSGALAANIKDAKANASQLETIAKSKNLKPQFLANAALTKLGNQRGSVVATAQGMLGVLQNLSVSIGTELANDNLIIIAAYNQGVANENLKMRDAIGKLAKNNPSVSSRQVRTIWFLRDRGVLTDSQFELALRFLAIGTITQNPKQFNVNATALTFN